MKLLTGVENMVPAGKHNLKVVIGTGTAVLQYEVDGEGFLDVPDTSVSASTGLSVDLPNCTVKTTLTGDAQVWLNLVARVDRA